MENQIEALAPWMSLDVPMNFEGTGSTRALIGAISGEMTLEAVYSLIAEYAPEAEGVDVTVLSADRDSTYIVALCLKKDAQQVRMRCGQGGFAKHLRSWMKFRRSKKKIWRQKSVLSKNKLILVRSILLNMETSAQTCV